MAATTNSSGPHRYSGANPDERCFLRKQSGKVGAPFQDLSRSWSRALLPANSLRKIRSNELKDVEGNIHAKKQEKKAKELLRFQSDLILTEEKQRNLISGEEDNLRTDLCLDEHVALFGSDGIPSRFLIHNQPHASRWGRVLSGTRGGRERGRFYPPQQ